MEDRNVKRGDIYHADLDPVFGSEQVYLEVNRAVIVRCW